MQQQAVDNYSVEKDMATSRRQCTSFLAESFCPSPKTPSLRNRQTLRRLRSRRRRSALPRSMTSLPVTGDFRCKDLVTRRSCIEQSMLVWVVATAAEGSGSATGPRRGTCRRLDAVAETSPPWGHYDVIYKITWPHSSLMMLLIPTRLHKTCPLLPKLMIAQELQSAVHVNRALSTENLPVFCHIFMLNSQLM